MVSEQALKYALKALREGQVVSSPDTEDKTPTLNDIPLILEEIGECSDYQIGLPNITNDYTQRAGMINSKYNLRELILKMYFEGESIDDTQTKISKFSSMLQEDVLFKPEGENSKLIYNGFYTGEYRNVVNEFKNNIYAEFVFEVNQMLPMKQFLFQSNPDTVTVNNISKFPVNCMIIAKLSRYYAEVCGVSIYNKVDSGDIVVIDGWNYKIYKVTQSGSTIYKENLIDSTNIIKFPVLNPGDNTFECSYVESLVIQYFPLL